MSSLYTFLIFFQRTQFRIELIPFLDDSGPTLCVNTDSVATSNMLTEMLAKTIRSNLPRMTPLQMQNNGFISGMFYFNTHRTHHFQILC